MKNHYFFLLIFFVMNFLGVGSSIIAQENQLGDLEKKANKIKKELSQLNQQIRFNTGSIEEALLMVRELDAKIASAQQLVFFNKEQTTLLSNRIKKTTFAIQEKSLTLQKIKDDYAKLIFKSYSIKKLQNSLIFLLSSESFYQAYKRIKYLELYAQHRKNQGRFIADEKKILDSLKIALTVEKNKKERVVRENNRYVANLRVDMTQRRNVIDKLQKQERDLKKIVSNKEKQSRAIEVEIKRLIALAIKKNNDDSTIVLTPEASLLATDFAANKGRLPWPLERGTVIQGFGKQQHPVVKTTTVKTSGVTIASTPNATVRAIFRGKTLAVVKYKGSNPIVLLQHGSYITCYGNLKSIFVKKGDDVAAKEAIGTVFTHPKTGRAVMQFSIFEGNVAQNPSDWLYEM